MPVSKRKGKRRKQVEARLKKQRKESEGQMTAKGRKSFIRKHAKDFRKFYQENMDKITTADQLGLPENLTGEEYFKWQKEHAEEE